MMQTGRLIDQQYDWRIQWTLTFSARRPLNDWRMIRFGPIQKKFNKYRRHIRWPMMFSLNTAYDRLIIRTGLLLVLKHINFNQMRMWSRWWMFFKCRCLTGHAIHIFMGEIKRRVCYFLDLDFWKYEYVCL